MAMISRGLGGFDKGARRGFTLVEMLIVIGIIALLTAVTAGAYSKMTTKADKMRAQELVSEVATALTKIYEKDGYWPKGIRDGLTEGSQGILSKENNAALILGKRKYLTLAMDKTMSRLIGRDRFGIVTPWAAKAVERGAESGVKVAGEATVQDNILHFAVDLDGDGIIKDVDIGGDSVNIRATAVVWCIGKSGGKHGQLWPYNEGRRHDDVYSWAYGQTLETDK